ncbi:MAG TPA: serine hydrolase domain-containing protein [Chitinophagaceae bacterium]|nr:serine hydrolase domain-containing protein [Chitinophagaceae bacterium]
MKAILALFLSILQLFAVAQYNLKSLDSLFSVSKPVISGKGGGFSVVLIKEGKTIYNNSFGEFDINKAVPIASASKWYAGALIMILVDEGKLSLEDKVSKYIPSFKGEKENITIKQCFSLTSGFAGSSEALDEFMENKSQTFAEMVDAIAKKELVAKPGEQLNYGGLAMQVAGRVAEIVSGKSWNLLFKEKIIEPLGLTKTYYGGVFTGAVPRIAGGVISSAVDYLKLLEMIAYKGMYKGKQILTEKAIQIMLSDLSGNATIGYSPFSRYKKNMQTSKDPRYGIGNWVIKDIDGITINVSPGAYGFTPWIDLKYNYYGIIAVRSSFPKVMPVFWSAIHIINKELDEKSAK